MNMEIHGKYKSPMTGEKIVDPLPASATFKLPEAAPTLDDMRPLIQALRNDEAVIVSADRLKTYIRMTRAMSCHDCSLKEGCPGNWRRWRDTHVPWPEGEPFVEEVADDSMEAWMIDLEQKCVDRHFAFLKGIIDG